MTVLADFLNSGIRLTTPILFCAIASLLSARAGVLNLAIEAKMLAGAFVGILAAGATGDNLIGVLAGAVTGATIGLVMAGANRLGATDAQVRDAVRDVEDAGDAATYLARTSTKGGWRRTRIMSLLNEMRGLGALHLSASERLALEMALNEESEYRALEGELAQLEQAWRDAGREGEPRAMALAYFALGESSETDARSYLGHYYAALGEEAANEIVATTAKDAETVRRYLQAFTDAGCDELVLFPCSPDPRQVDLLADAAL